MSHTHSHPHTRGGTWPHPSLPAPLSPRTVRQTLGHRASWNQATQGSPRQVLWQRTEGAASHCGRSPGWPAMQPPPECRLTALPRGFNAETRLGNLEALQWGHRGHSPGGLPLGPEGGQHMGTPTHTSRGSCPTLVRSARVTCDHHGLLGSVWGHGLLPRNHTQNDTWAGEGRTTSSPTARGV